MPTLNDKDQKRLSGFRLPFEVEEAVAEVWSTRYGGGNSGAYVSVFLIVSALGLIFSDTVPSLSPSVPLFVWMAYFLCAAFSMLTLAFVALGDPRRTEADTEANRRIFLSKTALNHVFATGIRKRLGSIAAGLFAFALVFTGHWPAALAFFFGVFSLSLGIGLLEYRTQKYLELLKEKLCRVETLRPENSGEFVFESPGMPDRRRFINRMKRPGVEIVDADFVEVPRK